MRSSFLGLEVSKRSIQLAQKALDITGNNLGNTQTDGYTRQRVDTASMYLTGYRAWQTKTSKLSLAGQGVQAFGVSQVRDPYIDKRYRDLNCYVSEYSRKSSVMKEVETTLDNIENVGLTQRLDKFKQALTKYATNAPDNVELASIVRNEASNICVMLNNYSHDLQKMKEDNVFELGAVIDQTNLIISKIAMYNEAILKEYKATEFDNIVNGTSVSQYGPLELMDQRNLLLDELSGYANIHVEALHDGTVKVSVGENTIVKGNGGAYETMVMQDYDNYGAAVLTWSNGEQARLQAGEIKAYVDILNGNGPYANFYQNSEYGIPYYQSAIDTFASDFAQWLNMLNGAPKDEGVWREDPGYLNKSPYPEVFYPERTEEENEQYVELKRLYQDRALFGSSDDVYDSNGTLTQMRAITAATICISDTWMVSATIIGQVQDENGVWTFKPNLDGTHNNQLLLGIENAIPFGRARDFAGTPYEYLAFLSNRLGQDINFTDELYDNAVVTTNNLLDNRDAVSGVSDTEEGINMMNYQKWFNASSRMMTTLDECLDRIINNMGRVGL